MDIQTINDTIRALVEDPNGDFADDSYLLPLLNLEYTDIENELRLYGPNIDEYVIELPNIQAGTPDLSAFMKQGKALYWLMTPREIEWKLAGTAATNYVDAQGPLDKLRDIQVPGIQALDCWSWTHFNIGLSMFSTALDLRLRGEFLFPPLTAGGDFTQIGNNVIGTIAYRVAKVIAMKRGNQQWVTNYAAQADRSFDAVKQGVVHLRQGQTERVGKVHDSGQWPSYTISQ